MVCRLKSHLGPRFCSNSKSNRRYSMPFVFGLFVGAVAWSSLKTFARPLARSAIKGTIVLGRKVQEIQAELAEDIQDLKAEAESDLRAETLEHPRPQTH